MAAAAPRTPRQIIDQAIRENRYSEKLYYAFAAVCMTSGAFALIVGALREQSVVAVAGGVATALFFPAMLGAQRIREKNIAIRLMEIPLTKAATSDEAVAALREFFVSALIPANNRIGEGSPPQQAGGGA